MKRGLISFTLVVLIVAAIACGAEAAPVADSTIAPRPTATATPAPIPTINPNNAPEAEETLSASPALKTSSAASQSAPTATPFPAPELSAPRPTATASPVPTLQPPPEPTPEPTQVPAPTLTPTPEPNAGMQMRQALSVDFVDMAWFSNSASKRVYGDRILGERLLFEFRYRNIGDRVISSFIGVVTFDDLSGSQVKSIPLVYKSTLPPLQEVTATYNFDPTQLVEAEQWLVDLCGPDFPSAGVVLTCRKSDMIVAFEANTISFTDGTRLEILR